MTPQDQYIQSQVAPLLQPGERVLFTAHMRRQPGLIWQILLIGGLLLVLMTKVYFAVLTDRRLILIRTKAGLFSGAPQLLNLGVEEHDIRKFSKVTTSGFANNKSMTFHSEGGKMTLRISPWLKQVSGTKDFLERVPDLLNSGQLAQLPAGNLAQPAYGAPPQQQYGASPQQQYGAPPPQAPYGAPPQQQYGAPPPQHYGAPPPAYAPPPPAPAALGPGAQVLVLAPDGQRYPGTVLQLQNGHVLCTMQNGQFWIPEASVSLA